MLRKMFPGVLVLCVMMVFMWTGCSNSTGSSGTGGDIGVSGTFVQTQQANGTSQPAVYTITISGTATQAGTGTISFNNQQETANVPEGATAAQIATEIYSYAAAYTAPYFTAQQNGNVITFTATSNSTEYNGIPCSISFN